MNKTTKRILFLIITLIIIGLIFYPKLDLFKTDAGNASQGSGGGGFRTMTVNGVVVNPTLLENKISVTGEVMANESLDIRSEISGKVEKIYFKEGQFIKRGQLLLKINADELNAQKQKVLYTQKLRQDLEFRQRQLLEREAISQEEYDQALNELQTAEADLLLLETQIEKSQIKAPFDGIIGLREISEGAYITPSNSIASFYSINPIKIEFAIPGKYSNRVNVGNEISFTVDASPEVFNGKVYAKEPRLNQNTRTLALRAISPNNRNILLPGQFARVEFLLDRKENALMIPTEAAIPELNGTKLFLSKGGKVSPAFVETGIRTDTHLEIISGLNPMDTVITTGIIQVRPGMDVNVNLN